MTMTGCDLCLEELRDSLPARPCRRCGALCCPLHDRCFGCGSMICPSCDTEPTPLHGYAGDTHAHPHCEALLT